MFPFCQQTVHRGRRHASRMSFQFVTKRNERKERVQRRKRKVVDRKEKKGKKKQHIFLISETRFHAHAEQASG